MKTFIRNKTKDPYKDNLSRLSLNRIIRGASGAALRISIVLDFITGAYGTAYGVSASDRAALVTRFYQIVRTIPAGTTALSHIVMAREILSTPPHALGDVIECGVWKGASTASLSLVCHLVGRSLQVCDSFQGLPDDGLQLYFAPHTKIYGYLKGGMFSGSLAEVEANVRNMGRLEVCEFVSGQFAESLNRLTRPIIFAFLDVDLPSSFQDCLRSIWPLMVDNGAIYVDDVGWMEIVQVFFDNEWWQQHLGCPAPGFVGSGCGLPISTYNSNIGYVRKLPPFHPGYWRKDPDLYYPAEQ